VPTVLFPADVTMTPAAQKLHAAEDVVAPGQQAPLDLTVFISCYNEQEFIVKTIATVRDALNEIGTISYEIIVVAADQPVIFAFADKGDVEIVLRQAAIDLVPPQQNPLRGMRADIVLDQIGRAVLRARNMKMFTATACIACL